MWPKWFIAEFHGEGPFTTEHAGKAYTKNDGITPAKSSALPGTHVPMCGTCNSTLDATIEKPAKEVIRRLIPFNSPHDWPALTPEESEALAKWLLKVGLLSAHPAAVHDRAQLNTDPGMPRFAHIPTDWLDWMRTGAAPPVEFSVYVARRAIDDPEPFLGERLRIILPKVIVDGVDLNFKSRAFGIRGLEVAIVWHPGWPITHPLVAEGRAAQLWPNPSAVDFAALPEVHPREFMFHDGSIGVMAFTAAQYQEATATPLNADMDPVIAFLGDALT